ncbi:hypothetical protein L3476_09600 [Paenibacillus thiaminolyticus]|nr:hypothetical protein [Paenibacillus thiaminolyticus]WCR28946.1 hypothetical protein L3476_09600 [Paenibacillus thiaminolyticus]
MTVWSIGEIHGGAAGCAIRFGIVDAGGRKGTSRPFRHGDMHDSGVSDG